MRIPTLLAVAAAAIGVSACTYVESPRQQPAPAAVVVPAPQQPAPPTTIVTPPPSPTVTVRPSY